MRNCSGGKVATKCSSKAWYTREYGLAPDSASDSASASLCADASDLESDAEVRTEAGASLRSTQLHTTSQSASCVQLWPAKASSTEACCALRSSRSTASFRRPREGRVSSRSDSFSGLESGNCKQNQPTHFNTPPHKHTHKCTFTYLSDGLINGSRIARQNRREQRLQSRQSVQHTATTTHCRGRGSGRPGHERQQRLSRGGGGRRWLVHRTQGVVGDRRRRGSRRAISEVRRRTGVSRR